MVWQKILATQFGANVKDIRFVKSGKYWTSAGVSADIDMSLELVREIKGDYYTKSVMLDLENDPQLPFAGGSETDSNIVKDKHAEYDYVMEALIHPNNALIQIKLDNTKDPVCGMPITSIGDTASYKGKIFGFCSPSCKKHFVKDPSAFITNIK